jgi:hypothetical protein
VNGCKKHIAFILTGIFVFPLMFQPIHIVWHHSTDHVTPGDESCCLHQNFAGDIPGESQPNDHCLICEYEFAVTSLPEVLVFGMIFNTIARDIKETAYAQAFRKIFFSNLLRAPPYSFFG